MAAEGDKADGGFFGWNEAAASDLDREGVLGLPAQLEACVYRQDPREEGTQRTRQAGPAEAVEEQGDGGGEGDGEEERDEFNVGIPDQDVADQGRQTKHARVGVLKKACAAKIAAATVIRPEIMAMLPGCSRAYRAGCWVR